LFYTKYGNTMNTQEGKPFFIQLQRGFAMTTINIRQKTLCSLILAASALAACGGGGGNSSTSGTGSSSGSSSSSTSGGTASAITVQGMISAFGSVVVNGVHYEVNSASIRLDDSPSSESDLDVGQMVRIDGELNADGKRGRAVKIEAETQVRGPISRIDLTQGVIVALGQTLRINADTFFKDDLPASQLKVGDIVRISSYTNAQGQAVATRVELKNDDSSSFQLTGKISQLDTTAQTFKIGDQTVDYRNSTLANLPGQTLTNGQLVRIQGRLVNGVLVASGSLSRSQLSIKQDDSSSSNASNLEVSGVVSNLANDRFTLGEITVITNSATRFDDGTAAQLANGVSVEVYGRWDADKNLLASRVEFKSQAALDSQGLVTVIDYANNTLTVNGVTYSVNADTRFKDNSRKKERMFDLQDVVNGDLIRVRAYAVGDKMVATRVERRTSRIGRENPSSSSSTSSSTSSSGSSSSGSSSSSSGAGSSSMDSDSQFEAKGRISAVSGSQVTLLGHTITVNASTQFDGYSNLNDFLAKAQGAFVEIHATLVGNSLVATHVEAEDSAMSRRQSELTDNRRGRGSDDTGADDKGRGSDDTGADDKGRGSDDTGADDKGRGRGSDDTGADDKGRGSDDTGADDKGRGSDDTGADDKGRGSDDTGADDKGRGEGNEVEVERHTNENRKPEDHGRS
jgi:hypothetical protein